MKKKIIYLFIFFLFFFLFIDDVKAVQCAGVQQMITDYNYYVQKEEESCPNENKKDFKVTAENTAICNNSKLQKNLIVADLMKYKEENAICEEAMTDVDNIIDENKDNCSRILDEGFNDFVNKVMLIFYILGPILLIVFGSIDYAKATAEGSEKALKKANKNFGKRIIATILLFLAPAITNFIISFNISDYYLSGNAYSCNYSFTVFNDIRNIGIVQIQRKNKYGSNDFSPKIGGITTEEQAEILNEQFNSMLNTQLHSKSGEYQNGPFPKWWTDTLQPFQCTWWAYGRASQYLEQFGTVYKEYPSDIMGHGGQYYDLNVTYNKFKYGQTPKPNSIISWKQGSRPGHVAYVEGVSSDGIYISHAGGGVSWFGVQKIPLSGEVFGDPSYKLNGYIYLDEPIQ